MNDLTQPLGVALIVPAHRGGPMLDACLRAAAAQTDAPDELVVVADGPAAGRDPELRRAVERADARLVVCPAPGGPGWARNTGAEATDSPVLFFVDSDVVLAPDSVARVRENLDDTDAVFGSYDEVPGDDGFTSQYKNLVHHLTHQRAGHDGATFWGACGAVRRTAFDRVGGFDESYGRPCVEDIELGYRLREHGHRLTIDKDLQVTHLKRWTVRGLLRTDLLDRAVPWSALILRSRVVVDDLGTERRARAQVALTAVAGAMLAAAPWLGRRAPVAAGGLAATVLALDAPVLGGLARLRGAGFAARALPWRLAHYGICAVGLAVAGGELAAEHAGVRVPRVPRTREPLP